MSYDVTIIGGGATGLSLAWLLARQGAKVALREATPHTGGLLAGFPIAGTRLEHYYHHYFTHDKELTHLLSCLKLQDHAFEFEGSMGIYRHGRLHAFSGPRDLLKLPFLSLPSKLRFALSSLYLSRQRQWRRHESQPALAWLRRYAGDAVVQEIWEPLFGIKFGPHAADIPLSWLVGRLSQRARSREGTQERLGYILGGFAVLAERLEIVCRELGVDIQTQSPVLNLEPSSKGWHCHSSKSRTTSEHVVLTLPTPLTRQLLTPVLTDLDSRVPPVDYYHAVCVVLALRRSLLPYYWTNVCDPGLPFGGIIEHTRGIPSTHYQGQHLLYLSRYHLHSDPLTALDQVTLSQVFLQGLTHVVPDLTPEDVMATHVFQTRVAAPICTGAFSNRVPHFDLGLAGLHVANMTHVYPDERSTNNAIRVALNVAQRLGTDVSDFPLGVSLAGQIGF